MPIEVVKDLKSVLLAFESLNLPSLRKKVAQRQIFEPRKEAYRVAQLLGCSKGLVHLWPRVYEICSTFISKVTPPSDELWPT